MRVRIGGVVWLVAAAILVACSGDDQPSTLPDATPTNADSAASEVANPSPSSDQLEADIKDFYEFYVQTINESWTSKEALKRRREMFADTCTSCLRGYQIAEEAQKQGLTLDAEPGTIHEIRLDDLDGDMATFLVNEDIPAGRLKDADGNVVRNFGATIGAQVVFRAQRKTPSQWVIIASDILSVEGGG
jgi:hypothetical protein